MAIDVEKLRERLRKERLVICPHCGYEHDSSQHFECMGKLVTYHGEEEPQEFTCQECFKVFFVKEHVERIFEEKKTMEEFE